MKRIYRGNSYNYNNKKIKKSHKKEKKTKTKRKLKIMRNLDTFLRSLLRRKKGHSKVKKKQSH